MISIPLKGLFRLASSFLESNFRPRLIGEKNLAFLTPLKNLIKLTSKIIEQAQLILQKNN